MEYAPLQPRPAASFDDSTPLVVAGVGAAALAGLLIATGSPLALAALAGIAFAPVALLDLRLAVVLWIPLTFVDRVNLAPNLLTLILALAWLALLPAALPGVREFVRTNVRPLALLAGVLGWVTLTISWAADPGVAFADLWLWYAAAVIFVLVATMITTRRHAGLAIVAFVVGAILSIAVGAGLAGEGVSALEEGRFGGSLGDPNELAAGLVPAMALCVGIALAWGGRWRLPALLAITALGIALAATGSRGGLIAGLVGVAAAIAISRGKRIQFTAVALATLILAGAWVASNSPGTWDRLREFDASGTGRADLWTVAWRIGEDNLLGGVGINNYREVAGGYVFEPGRLEAVEFISEQPHFVHNVYLQQFAETGIVGAMLLIAFLLAVLAATWSAIQRFERGGDWQMAIMARAVLIAQIAVLTASTFLSNGHDKRLWVILGLGLALRSVPVRPTNRREVLPHG